MPVLQAMKIIGDFPGGPVLRLQAANAGGLGLMPA